MNGPLDVERTVPPTAVAELVGSEIVVTDIGGHSVQGAGRVRNEDAWGHRHTQVFVAADGIGGRRHGDIASKSAVRSLLYSLADEVADWRDPMRRASHSVMTEPPASDPARVTTPSDERPGSAGAVAVALRCIDGRASLVHVGDARAYRVRDGLIEPLTRDHSVGVVMADLGVRRLETGLADRELASLTSFFGEPRSWEEFTVRDLTVRSADRIVLCTDGCYRHLDRGGWAPIVGAMSASDAATHLVEHAVEAGSRDDATAVVVDLVALPSRHGDRPAR